MTGLHSDKMDLNKTETCQPPDDSAGNVFLQVFLMIETLVGLPGSILALWIFCCRMKLWKAHVVFLFNLVLADFLLLISVPFRIDSHWRGDNWTFGPTWCKINLYMLSVNRSASIAFMTVVALERYFKVVHPHHNISRLTPTQAGVLAGLIWLCVISLRIPLLTTNLLQKRGNISLCRSFNSYKKIPLPLLVHYAAFVMEFFLPWLVLLFCSAKIVYHLHKLRLNREKVRRAIRVVTVISMVFTFCFMPSVFTGLMGLYIKAYHPNECASYNMWIYLFMICMGFTYLNSALDPVIYFFSSSSFQETLKNSFTCRKNARAAISEMTTY
ncbi:hydroxycarboxylic acid receptor 2 [Kryptolebias marmoratus]|uniref:Hydroxycarboxylic acid receptor 1-3 n=1 Tax=Kryptolebias marmoratus TaxID=37003 RepID=A0A3Q3AV79_KRYMA|nr:hydroxycarboxylic acid receptor 2 [Kryptolebias marmoratus]